MALKGDADFIEKLPRGLKIEIKYLVNSHTSCRKSENFHLDGLLIFKVYKDLDEKIQKSYVS